MVYAKNDPLRAKICSGDELVQCVCVSTATTIEFVPVVHRYLQWRTNGSYSKVSSHPKIQFVKIKISLFRIDKFVPEKLSCSIQRNGSVCETRHEILNTTLVDAVRERPAT